MTDTGSIAAATALATLLLAMPVRAQTVQSSAGPLTATVITGGLDHPWGLEFLPDGRIIVTERSGQVRIITDGVTGEPVEGVPDVFNEGEGGLLDIALAPDFQSSGRLYLAYVEPAADAGLQRGQSNAVMAATLEQAGETGRLVDQEVIFRVEKFTTRRSHFGSRIEFDASGNLFVTTGDQGDMERAQDFADTAGGIIRIAPDGSVPADNPRPEGWAPELWSKGHRNPQGLTLRASDGAIFTVEHGARGGDEVNMPRAGANYGWPIITYGVDYSGAPIGEGTAKDGLEQPLHYWDPSISPSGLDFYEADLIGGWDGDLLSGGLSGQVLVRLDVEGDEIVGEERLFEGQLGRIRDVRVGPDGAIYLLTDEDNGRLIRVAPEGR
ncbi:PQQ-dependent sugar dehydrogenase [Devosia sp.]|uniref:PQQ-dependent sugar dehydrogenase n=1 Tax=Devosia sp. TaxID=1871048 RepID=UPI002FC8DEB0